MVPVFTPKVPPFTEVSEVKTVIESYGKSMTFWCIQILNQQDIDNAFCGDRYIGIIGDPNWLKLTD